MVCNQSTAVTLADLHHFGYVVVTKQGRRYVGYNIVSVTHDLEVLKSSLDAFRYRAPEDSRASEAYASHLCVRAVKDAVLIAKQRDSCSV